MESSERKKTVYLTKLEDAERKIKSFTADMTTEGMRLYLLFLLHEIKRTDEFFAGVETRVSQAEFTADMLEIDADVDYCERASEKYWQLPQKYGGTQDNRRLHDELADTIGQLRNRLQGIGRKQSARKLTWADGEKLYREEEGKFGLSGASEVVADFNRWKGDCEDDTEIILKRLEGKKLAELKAFFESGFLESKIAQQSEMDFSAYRAEVDMERLKGMADNFDVEAHYSAMREFFHCRNGVLVPRKDKIGKYFFKHRKEMGEAHREACFRLVRMLALIEEERKPKPAQETLNYEGIRIAMTRTYFPKCTQLLCRGFDADWLGDYMTDLMKSGFSEELARHWAVRNKRITIVCLILGALKEAGVLTGSYSVIAKQMDEANSRTWAKYIGQAKRHAISEWTSEYIGNKKQP